MKRCIISISILILSTISNAAFARTSGEIIQYLSDNIPGSNPRKSLFGTICADSNSSVICKDKGGWDEWIDSDVKRPQPTLEPQTTTPQDTQVDLRNWFNDLPKSDRIAVQVFLSNRHLYNSTIDGYWGRGTESAIRAYINQENNNAPVEDQLSQLVATANSELGYSSTQDWMQSYIKQYVLFPIIQTGTDTVESYDLTEKYWGLYRYYQLDFQHPNWTFQRKMQTVLDENPLIASVGGFDVAMHIQKTLESINTYNISQHNFEQFVDDAVQSLRLCSATIQRRNHSPLPTNSDQFNRERIALLWCRDHVLANADFDISASDSAQSAMIRRIIRRR